MDESPRTRVVLLGASNLTLAFPLVVARLRALLPGPLEILAAIGHGRSYGRMSRVVVRELPGIAQCGLWDALAAGPARPTFALLSDLGNDVVYGSAVDEIAGWIDADLERLAAIGARSALVRLPLDSVASLSPLRFRLARQLIFPSHRIDLATVRERVTELDARIVRFGEARRLPLVAQEGAWYGLDPIHIRRRLRPQAWEKFLRALLPESPAVAGARLSPADRRALRAAAPQWRRWMGRVETRAQPSARLLDGTTIALY